MKIFFAGQAFPANEKREAMLKEKYFENRLLSFFHLQPGGIHADSWKVYFDENILRNMAPEGKEPRG